MKFHILVFMALILAGCASAPSQKNAQKDASLGKNVSSAASSAMDQTQDGFTDAVLSPLEDLNLRKNEIPALLADMKSPYDVPHNLSCDDIAGRVLALNRVLGSDWDAITPDERLRSQKLAERSAEATLGAVASEARGMIPFRGVVRYASGAEKYSKKYAKAFVIGAQRRAYLKGVGLANDCSFPARPDFALTADSLSDDIIFKGDDPDRGRAPPRSQPTVSRRIKRTFPARGETTSSSPIGSTK